MIKETRYSVNKEEFEILREMGFIVDFKMPWHVRVSKEAYQGFFIDVWPTKKKYCTNTDGRFSQSNYYKDLSEMIETKFMDRL